MKGFCKADKEQNKNTFLKHFFYESPLASYSCNNEGYIIHYNNAAVALWGIEPQIGKDLWCGSLKIYYTDGQPMPYGVHPMAKALKEGKSYDKQTITIETADHSFKTLLVFARPVFDENYKQIGAHSTMVDITEQSISENKQAILAAIVESSENAIISKNLNGVITSWNMGAEKMFGYSEEEILGKNITLLIPSSRLNEEENILKNIKAGNRVDHLQTIRITKSGAEVAISLSVSPVKDSEGKIMGASKIARDISEELKAQEAIRRNTKNLEILNSIGKTFLENLDVKVILQKITDATTKITGAQFGAFFYNTINEEGEEFKLYTLSGSKIENFEKIGMPRNTSIFDLTFNLKQVLRSDDITKDPRYGNNKPYAGMPEGHPQVLSYLAVPVISISGTVVGSLLFGHQNPGIFTAEHEDIVGSIASQAAIALDNSRLFEEVKALSAKKDEFIALASHELKTPLTSIKGYLQISVRADKENIGRMLNEKALNQVEKLNTLVTDLLDSSKIVAGKLQFNLETFDMRMLILEIVENFKYAKTTHEVLFNDPEQEFIIEADRQRIEQVISNLLNNAIKYSPGEDKVFISMEGKHGQVKVKIKDEGIGLTPSQKSKIFARFYRVDGPTNVAGLGLGLYLTKEIIDRHQGNIDVDINFEKGSEFFFTLPLK